MSELVRRGFVLDRRPFREHDLQLTLLTEDGAALDALAPSGQQSKRRFAGGLSPLSLYRFALTPSRKGFRLDEAAIERAWPALWSSLARQSVVLCASALAGSLAEPLPGDPQVFLLLAEMHEQVSADATPELALARLVRFAFEMLTLTGRALVLDRCVRCEAPAPDQALVTTDPAAGGVVCRACGGGDFRVTARDRAALRAVVAGELGAYHPGLVAITARLVGGVVPEAGEVIVKGTSVLAT